jgi:predicted dehydrogenase
MLRGAIIGFGKIAQQGHLPAYRATGSRLKITSVVEPDSIFRRGAGMLLPGANLYESIDDLLDCEILDFVDICSPPAFHADAIKRAHRAGLNIICEKPFATSLTEAAELRDLLENYDRVFMPCHQYRYSPIWAHFKNAVNCKNGDYGNLLQFNVYRTGADPGFLTSNPDWRTDPRMSGGGILADTGVHYIYLALWILGLPVSLSAVVANLYHHNYHIEDTAAFNLLSEKGLAQVTLTWGADRRANSARLTNHHESLYYNGTSLERFNPDGREILPVPDASDKLNYISLYISLFNEFADRIERGVDSSDWIEEAFRSIQILHACYHSAATGQAVLFENPPGIFNNSITKRN